LSFFKSTLDECLSFFKLFLFAGSRKDKRSPSSLDQIARSVSSFTRRILKFNGKKDQMRFMQHFVHLCIHYSQLYLIQRHSFLLKINIMDYIMAEEDLFDYSDKNKL